MLSTRAHRWELQNKIIEIGKMICDFHGIEHEIITISYSPNKILKEIRIENHSEIPITPDINKINIILEKVYCGKNLTNYEIASLETYHKHFTEAIAIRKETGI